MLDLEGTVESAASGLNGSNISRASCRFWRGLAYNLSLLGTVDRFGEQAGAETVQKDGCQMSIFLIE